MKKFALILIFIFLSFSCTELIDFSEIECKISETYNPKLAANVAMKAFYPFTRSSRSQECEEVFPYIDDNGDTLAVVVDYGLNNGFVILTKDCNKVLLLSDDSDYQEILGLPSVSLMLKEVAEASNFPIIDPSPTPVSYMVRDTSVQYTPPMIQVGWHQGSPYNLYAINPEQKFAGCTPVAIALVMSYYEFPNVISLSFDNAPVSTLELNWNSMKAGVGYHGELCTECLQKAGLLRQIGEMCDADYLLDGTFAWPYVEYLNDMYYTGVEYDEFILAPIVASLSNHKPCIISGFNDEAGHTWVIDGYRRINYTEITYELKGLGAVETDRLERRETYLHFNLGRMTNNSFFCLSDVFETASGTHVYGGSYTHHPISIFDSPSYTDVELLVTDVEPIN